MLLALVIGLLVTAAQELPDGYWPESWVAEILEKTEMIHLSPDLTSLDAHEAAALDSLLRVGAITQTLNEDARHRQALKSHVELQSLNNRLGRPQRTKALLDLYRLFQEPIATTLDNSREPFLPVGPQVPARNVYPPDATKEEINHFLERYPKQRDTILAKRSIVRRATRENLTKDLGAFSDGALGTLHAELKSELGKLSAMPDPKVFYAVPYPVAYASELREVFHLLDEAAGKMEATDGEFAAYLRNRARDFLSNDYESGDASWVTERFGRLNAQIGAYVTYDDALFGVKAFPSVACS